MLILYIYRLQLDSHNCMNTEKYYRRVYQMQESIMFIRISKAKNRLDVRFKLDHKARNYYLTHPIYSWASWSVHIYTMLTTPFTRGLHNQYKDILIHTENQNIAPYTHQWICIKRRNNRSTCKTFWVMYNGYCD